MFKKYCSIKNHYSTKEIERWLSEYPQLKNCKYEITEKLHGCNISLIFVKNEKMRIASRNRICENFRGVLEIIENDIKLKSILEVFQNLVNREKIVISLFGEIFGEGIQKGAYYGKDKYIRFFDLTINGKYITQKKFENYKIINNYKTPRLGMVNSLKEALEFNIDINSKITNKENNKIEGIVIKPYEKVYCSPTGSIFYLKKVNEKFKEKKKKCEIRVKINKEWPKEVIILNLTYSTFITKNRLNNIFSKYGKIENEKQVGKYLGLFLKDAWKDFLIEYREEYERIIKKYAGVRKIITNVNNIAKKIILNSLLMKNEVKK